MLEDKRYWSILTLLNDNFDELCYEITQDAQLHDEYPVSYTHLTDTEKELNEYAHKWLHNIIDKQYHLEKMRIFLNNYPTEVEYGTDGLISSFDGSDDDLKYFREQFDSDPQRRISILVAEHENEIKDLPPQKELFEDVEIIETVNIPNMVYQPTSDIASHKLYPEVSNNERHDFAIKDMDLGAGGPKEKYRANVQAIQLLKKLELEHRLATPDEQEILSHYVCLLYTSRCV